MSFYLWRTTFRISAAAVLRQKSDQCIDASHFSAVTHKTAFLNGGD
jgi:hypothetical protein